MASQNPRDNDSGRFPFLHLPLELRQQVYREALSPLVDFFIVHPPYTGYKEPCIVSPEISCSTTSLFLVNKQVSSEALQVIAGVCTIITASISSVKIHSSLPLDFLSLCKQSRFVFNGWSVSARWFFGSLPEELGNSILSIAIFSAFLYMEDLGTLEDWSKSDSQLYSPFIASIRSNLPALREVSLYVLARGVDFYCTEAPMELCGLLEDKTFDELRLLYDGFVDVDYVSRKYRYVAKAIIPQPTLRGELNVLAEFEEEGRPKFRVTVESKDFAFAGNKITSVAWLTRW